MISESCSLVRFRGWLMTVMPCSSGLLASRRLARKTALWATLRKLTRACQPLLLNHTYRAETPGQVLLLHGSLCDGGCLKKKRAPGQRVGGGGRQLGDTGGEGDRLSWENKNKTTSSRELSAPGQMTRGPYLNVVFSF